MIDGDGSGKVSKSEMEFFLKLVAPPDMTASKIRVLITLIFIEADKNQSGFITFEEFVQWDGHIDVLNWADSYHQKVLRLFIKASDVALSTRSARSTAVPAGVVLPWSHITNDDVIKAFTSQAWDGELTVAEFGRVLTMLGINQAVTTKLFESFDRDHSGMLDFREAFVGLSLLCSNSREERLECAFQMIDANDSGAVSREEILVFLKSVAPASATRHQLGLLALQIVHEADTNKTGLVHFREFLRWPGKHQVLEWIDAHHDRIVSAVFEEMEPPTSVSEALLDKYVWSRLTTKEVMRVWQSERWTGDIGLREFQSLVLRLGGAWVEDQSTVQELFSCFDRDLRGSVDVREIFMGLILLCSDSRDQRLTSMFSVVDDERSGKISRDQLESFVRFLWPSGGDAMHDVRIALRTSRIMLEADLDRTGFLSVDDYHRWEGKELELKQLDARLVSILSSFEDPNAL